MLPAKKATRKLFVHTVGLSRSRATSPLPGADFARPSPFVKSDLPAAISRALRFAKSPPAAQRTMVPTACALAARFRFDIVRATQGVQAKSEIN